ncbi:hypothetical protein CHLRE_02g073150v5 [Chlamydomonas reinhardtii]|uniref:Uncharacterized protein n=1 Tax=Chlamydomonas reinhardtii TaxID=3055 RepID=A0A2K3DZY0_CHLRE|nr:uncharacterized protein CHLRE_02g073150v5 [Chlamydomonas reinhardtii]PNW86096.1 hypothetical protein CHLRE_02g073150v5 [Chlamydomonas reinhardtii]
MQVPASLATKAFISHLFQLDPSRVKLICHGSCLLDDHAVKQAAAAGHSVVLLSSRSKPVGRLQQCWIWLWSWFTDRLSRWEATASYMYSHLTFPQPLELFLRSLSPTFTPPPLVEHSSQQ